MFTYLQHNMYTVNVVISVVGNNGYEAFFTLHNIYHNTSVR